MTTQPNPAVVNMTSPVPRDSGISVAAHRRPRVSEIVATGYAYPSEHVDNDTFLSRCRFPISDDIEALARDSRMKTRRWCAPGENTWTLARDAVDMLLAQGTVRASEIDVVLVSSCSTIPLVNYPEPENPVVADLAPLILARLGRDDAIGIDVKATYCAGFIRCLEMLDALLENPNYRTGLIVATDQGGRFATAESNRSAFCFIVGDAAGAVALRKRPRGERVGIVDYLGSMVVSKRDLTTWGPDGRSLLVRGGRAQAALLEAAVDCGKQLLQRNGIRPQDVDWLLPMQSHALAVDALVKALEWPPEKVLWRGDLTGYSASASIPACLAERIASGVVKKGDLVMSLAVGAGMNTASALYYV